MRFWTLAAAMVVMGALGGCAVQIQQPLPMAAGALAPGNGKVGVAMTDLPKVDTAFPGAGCLLCLAVANGAHSSLNSHVQSLPYEDVPDLKALAAALLNKKGIQAAVIQESLKLDTLPDFSSDKPNFARKDFRSLRDRHGVDKLVVVSVHALGVWRNYASYVPTEEPKAVFNATAYMVNLRDNSLEWYAPIAIRKGAAKWDQPPKFPELTNAYFQAIELGKDAVLQPLK